jgi:hypothetical protein
MTIPTLVALLGLVVYFVAPGKASELGRIMFFVGLFWLVSTVSRQVTHLP